MIRGPSDINISDHDLWAEYAISCGLAHTCETAEDWEAERRRFFEQLAAEKAERIRQIRDGVPRWS